MNTAKQAVPTEARERAREVLERALAVAASKVPIVRDGRLVELDGGEIASLARAAIAAIREEG